MKFKKMLAELRKDPKNAVYFIQGHFNWFLHGKAIKKYYAKRKECAEWRCFEDNKCYICGCDFNALALSSKRCTYEARKAKQAEYIVEANKELYRFMIPKKSEELKGIIGLDCINLIENKTTEEE
jgi:hypothetical protein